MARNNDSGIEVGPPTIEIRSVRKVQLLLINLESEKRFVDIDHEGSQHWCV